MLDNLADTAEPTRFGFGRNWLSFIEVVDEARIRATTSTDWPAAASPATTSRWIMRMAPKASVQAEVISITRNWPRRTPSA